MGACPKAVPCTPRTKRYLTAEQLKKIDGVTRIVKEGRERYKKWTGRALGFDIFRITRGRAQAGFLFWVYYFTDGLPHDGRNKHWKAPEFTEALLPQDYADLLGLSVQWMRAEIKDALLAKPATKKCPARPPLVERLAEKGPRSYRFRLNRAAFAEMPNTPESDGPTPIDSKERIEGERRESVLSPVRILAHKNQKVTELVFGDERRNVMFANETDGAVNIAASITATSLEFKLETATADAPEILEQRAEVIEIPSRGTAPAAEQPKDAPRKHSKPSAGPPRDDGPAQRGESVPVATEALMFRLGELGFVLDREFCYRVAAGLRCPPTFYLDLVREKKRKPSLKNIGKGLLFRFVAEANELWIVHCQTVANLPTVRRDQAAAAEPVSKRAQRSAETMAGAELFEQARRRLK